MKKLFLFVVISIVAISTINYCGPVKRVARKVRKKEYNRLSKTFLRLKEQKLRLQEIKICTNLLIVSRDRCLFDLDKMNELRSICKAKAEKLLEDISGKK